MNKNKVGRFEIRVDNSVLMYRLKIFEYFFLVEVDEYWVKFGFV